MSNKLNPRDYATDDVVEATLKVVREKVKEFSPRSDRSAAGWIDTYQVVWGVTRSLEPKWYEKTKGQWPGQGFADKVKRALEVLVTRGLVVKRTGIGNSWRNHPRWATPEYAVEYDTQQADAAEVVRVADEDFKLLVKRAAAVGLEIGGNRHGVDLTIEDTDRIVRFFEETGEVIPRG